TSEFIIGSLVGWFAFILGALLQNVEKTGKLGLIVGSFVCWLFGVVVSILVVGGIAHFIADRAGGGQKTEILRGILERTSKFLAYFLFGMIFFGGFTYLIIAIIFGWEI
ncbi:MAG: hypothetical protein ACE5LA_06200, partial [Dehalococcoidales bacterium]